MFYLINKPNITHPKSKLFCLNFVPTNKYDSSKDRRPANAASFNALNTVGRKGPKAPLNTMMLSSHLAHRYISRHPTIINIYVKS